jgi:hypothetical protein
MLGTSHRETVTRFVLRRAGDTACDATSPADERRATGKIVLEFGG